MIKVGDEVVVKNVKGVFDDSSDEYDRWIGMKGEVINAYNSGLLNLRVLFDKNNLKINFGENVNTKMLFMNEKNLEVINEFSIGDEVEVIDTNGVYGEGTYEPDLLFERGVVREIKVNSIGHPTSYYVFFNSGLYLEEPEGWWLRAHQLVNVTGDGNSKTIINKYSEGDVVQIVNNLENCTNNTLLYSVGRVIFVEPKFVVGKMNYLVEFKRLKGDKNLTKDRADFQLWCTEEQLMGV